jgi:hypothetical protein
MALSVGLIGARNHVVAAWSPSAKLYAAAGLPVNLRGLEIVSLRSVVDLDDGRKVLTVEGELANITGRELNIPELRLSVWGQKKEFYSWTAAAPRPALRAGERIAFRTRLASPPDDAADVLVQFVKAVESMPRTEKMRLSWLSPLT